MFLSRVGGPAQLASLPAFRENGSARTQPDPVRTPPESNPNRWRIADSRPTGCQHEGVEYHRLLSNGTQHPEWTVHHRGQQCRTGLTRHHGNLRKLPRTELSNRQSIDKTG